MGATLNLDFLEMFRNDWFLLSDMADMFFGEFLGNGHARAVYRFRLDDRYVVKVDRGGHFDNIAEWDVWHNVDDKYRKFFAPCLRISSCGRILLQERTEPVTRDQLPYKIPGFFTDLKTDNWGKLGDRVVCHDYANTRFYSSKYPMLTARWLDKPIPQAKESFKP